MKTCTCCKKPKPFDMFPKHARMKDGLGSQCKQCCKEKQANYRAENPGKNAESCRAYHDKNRDKLLVAIKERSKRWYSLNKDKARDKSQRWRQENSEQSKESVTKWRVANREKHRAAVRCWAANNPLRLRTLEAKRRAAVLQAIPKWADFKAIERVYERSQLLRQMGVDVHVDHVLPLQGAVVCGLHVADNLQIILAGENIAKGDRLIHKGV